MNNATHGLRRWVAPVVAVVAVGSPVASHVALAFGRYYGFALLLAAAQSLAGGFLLWRALPRQRWLGAVAGGILLFITAADMVRGSHGVRETDPERQAAIRTDDDIAIFPLGIPLIAGPGGMTTMVVLHSHAGGDWTKILAIEAAVAVTFLLTLLCLLGARWIAHARGEAGTSVAGRVLGVLLAALAVQIALDGLHQAFAGG